MQIVIVERNGEEEGLELTGFELEVVHGEDILPASKSTIRKHTVVAKIKYSDDETSLNGFPIVRRSRGSAGGIMDTAEKSFSLVFI